MPLGAFIFIDIWIFPKIGLINDYAEKAKLSISWPATFAWIGSLLFSVFMYGKDNYAWLTKLVEGRQPPWLANIKLDLMLLIAPEWIVAVTLYLVFCIIQQKTAKSKIQYREAGQ
jgi:hypothetical protein